MLAFTLSKMNLLILVTALFAIIAFFLFGLTDIVVAELAQQMVNDYSKTASGLVSGQVLCRKSTTTVPEAIQYFGGLMPGMRFYYVMHVKRFPETPEEGELTSLIFQIASRKERDKIIATSSIDVNAKILLYDWDPETDIFLEKPAITLDPASAGVETKNSMVLVKELYNGQRYLHVIACASSSAICENNFTRASCWLSKCADIPRTSTCFPKPGQEDCENMSCGG